MILTIIVFICIFSYLLYEDYIYKRGKYLYSVLVGVENNNGDIDEDSIEDYREYGNSILDVTTKVRNKYAKDNEVDPWEDVIVLNSEMI